MKHKFLFLSFIVFAFVSCIKQVDKTFQGTPVVEIDATPLNSNAVGVNYPILTRVVPQGRPIATVDSTLRRYAGTVRVRVNLVGAQSGKDETVGYQIATSSPITSIAFPATISGQTPSATAATLTVSTAVAGTHYTALSGKVTIPANSSFGFINVQVLNPGASAGQARYLGIKLDSTGTLLPSANYLQLGLLIDQR